MTFARAQKHLFPFLPRTSSTLAYFAPAKDRYPQGFYPASLCARKRRSSRIRRERALRLNSPKDRMLV